MVGRSRDRLEHRASDGIARQHRVRGAQRPDQHRIGPGWRLAAPTIIVRPPCSCIRIGSTSLSCDRSCRPGASSGRRAGGGGGLPAVPPAAAGARRVHGSRPGPAAPAGRPRTAAAAAAAGSAAPQRGNHVSHLASNSRRAAAEVETLPPDSLLASMLSDYAAIPDQVQACQGR